VNLETKFGTNGWRGLIADDFTFANVKLVAQAIAQYIIDDGLAEKGVVIGYDNRFLSDSKQSVIHKLQYKRSRTERVGI
jgi:phosphomannomutase